ncbi:MAG TPA: cell division protein SepF [Syntrophomonadaceae bacterium]|nr:cell division protein SepF [Syntrophomonadaceae bacterium]
MGLTDKVWSWLGVAEEEVHEELITLPPGPEVNSRQMNNVVPIHSNKTMKVVMCEPQTFDEVQVLADHLKNRKQLIISFENTTPDIARRVIDFLSGSIYSLDGTCQQLGSNIFVFAPSNMEISRDKGSIMRRHNFWNPSGGER